MNEVDRKIQAALEACGNQAVTHTKQNIDKAGRVDTGTMMNSITHQVQDDVCYIGTNVEYAVYQEYGTKTIKPAHFLKDAMQNNLDEYKAIIESNLKG